jgi:hypothetical protein
MGVAIPAGLSALQLLPGSFQARARLNQKQHRKFSVDFGVTLNQKPSQLVTIEKVMDIR